MSKGEVIDPKNDGRVKHPEKYMGAAELTNLKSLFEHLLQDMYYAENRIAETLPKMAEKAVHSDLIAGFKKHLEETRDQIEKLEKVFKITGLEKKREECEAIEGLLGEGEDLMKEAKPGAVLDSAMIAAAQKVEHYEIASYGTLCNMAKLLGQKEAGQLLHEILEQEKATDEKLSKICDGIEKAAMDKKAA